jgi:hypothetical protein
MPVCHIILPCHQEMPLHGHHVIQHAMAYHHEILACYVKIVCHHAIPWENAMLPCHEMPPYHDK